MYRAVAVITILFSGVTALVIAGAGNTWEYSISSVAEDRRPCLTNCKDSRCMINWNGSTKECRTNNQPAAKFYTSGVMDKSSKYCLSNCGYFGYHYQWCVTTEQKGWDYCNAGRDSVSVFNKKCRGDCQRGLSGYYWCYVGDGIDWQYCAPPREQDDDGYDIDPRQGYSTK